MPTRLSELVREFPRQFWILLGGTLINSVGSGIVFPFLTLYLHEHLNLSLTLVGFALTLWAASQVVGQVAGGSLTDRFGRKRLMVLSLASNVILLPLFGLADTLPVAALVSVLLGSTGALYQPARDAMVADIVETHKRPQAYGLVRVGNNLGIAIGPAIGGFLAARSFLLMFLVSAAATFVYLLVTVLLMHETRPQVAQGPTPRQAEGTFADVLRNTPFVVFSIATTLVVMSAVQMMTVLPVYMKDQFGLGETYYGWVMTTNAAMVVLFQFPITRATARAPRLVLMTAGALLYAVGVGGVALGSSFEHFILAMAVTTLGEMVITPTATSVTADLAPTNMRGRYMSVIGLTWSLAFAIGPVLGGLVSDQFAPRLLWPAMAGVAVAGGALCVILGRFVSLPAPQSAASAVE